MPEGAKIFRIERTVREDCEKYIGFIALYEEWLKGMEEFDDAAFERLVGSSLSWLSAERDRRRKLAKARWLAESREKHGITD